MRESAFLCKNVCFVQKLHIFAQKAHFFRAKTGISVQKIAQKCLKAMEKGMDHETDITREKISGSPWVTLDACLGPWSFWLGKPLISRFGS